MMLCSSVSAILFLSTPSARRATWYMVVIIGQCDISIHALREEGDLSLSVGKAKPMYFYPRPPRGGRPFNASHKTNMRYISIHALREEGDSALSERMAKPMYFYPRPPRGGRQQKQRQNLYFLINYTTFCTNLEEP